MTNDLQIHIPTPCHENWDAMTPEAKGRFCGSCAKVVVDFSVMTDNEMLTFLQKNTGSTCGHFTTDQLERPIIETQLQPKRTWRYWLASIASLLVMLQRSAAQPKSALIQGKVLVKKQVKLLQEKRITQGVVIPKIILCSDEDIMREIAKKPAILQGIVMDENAVPIAFATITTKEKLGITNTDSAGRFSIHTKKYVDNATLIVSCIGYESKEITIDADSPQLQTIQLKKKAAVLPEVTVIGYGTHSISCRIGGFTSYRRVSKIDTIPLAIAKVFKNEAFTIYPNPVSKNGTIHISIKDAGNYDVQILSNQSKLLYSQQHSTQSLKQVIQFAVPNGAVAGMYYVRLINTATQKQWVDKLMIQ